MSDNIIQDKGGQFIVQATVRGKQRYVGRFATHFDAEAALAEAQAAESAPVDQFLPELAREPEIIEVAAQEILRNLVNEVVSNAGRPPPASSFQHPEKVDARVCRFGLNCRRDDVRHFMEADHPDGHPKLGLPAPLPPPFSLSSLPPCQHWRRKGYCLVGDECLFRHGQSERGDLSRPGLNHRVRLEAGTWKNRGKRNGSRGAVLRRFLIDHFGIDFLRSGSGVLDVAGGGSGGGGLAFQLLNYSGIQATVIDPRPPVHNKAVEVLTYSGAQRRAPFNAAYDTDVTPRGEPARRPRFICRYVNSSPEFVAPATEAAPASRPKKSPRGSSSDSPHRGAAEEPICTPGSTSPGDGGGPTYLGEVTNDSSISSIIAECSVVCGLHPDGATEPLVDFAIAHRKPFIVVPCCVFWRSNSGLQDAGVRRYDEFLNYLAAKLPPGEIRRVELAFDGRNTALWWPGDGSHPLLDTGAPVEGTSAPR